VPTSLSGQPPRAAGPDIAALFDEAAGTVNPSIYADPAIYELELERVFARSWLVVAHESHVPGPGNYLASYMAEDPVIVVRQKDGSIRVLLNQCRHRGMKLCRTDAGRTRGFICSYHGWAYDICGRLVNVPLEERSFPGLDKSRWGIRQARVETYKGLVFATWNEAAAPLIDFLGDAALYLDAILDRSEGGTEAIGGIVKWVIPCNWKFAAEQFCSDMYHGGFSHSSIQIAASGEGSVPDMGGVPSRQFRSKAGGHGTGFFVNSTQWMYRIAQTGHGVEGFDPTAPIDRIAGHSGEARSQVMAQHMTVFPNFSVFAGVDTARIWHPRGPGEIEVWAFGLVDKAASPAEREQARLSTLRTFSPAGTWEQDDGENWVEIQRVLRGREARKTVLNMQMGKGVAVDEDGAYPGTIPLAYSEEAARGFYAHWQKMLLHDGVAPIQEAVAHAAE
jgi:phenylpropionate dioxygenase-like ring-hydroxylating dioxygenase large terminal subunit